MAQTPYGGPYYGSPYYTGSPSQSAPVGLDSNPAEDLPNAPAVILPHPETTGLGDNCHVVIRHALRPNGDRITVRRTICE
jgi:hypothetical protein